MISQDFQTEIEFELPRGFSDSEGTLHKKGKMRMATAADEINPYLDPRTKQNELFSTIIILSRVVISLGSLPSINTNIIENLFSIDLAYLLDLYNRLNRDGSNSIKTLCPHCKQEFLVDLSPGED